MTEKRRAPEPDLVECECGITFAALRCPGLDCQKVQPGMVLCTEAECAILAEVDAMFTRSPQWFANFLPTLHKMLNDRERAHVAAVMSRKP